MGHSTAPVEVDEGCPACAQARTREPFNCVTQAQQSVVAVLCKNLTFGWSRELLGRDGGTPRITPAMVGTPSRNLLLVEVSPKQMPQRIAKRKRRKSQLNQRLLRRRRMINVLFTIVVH
eukprot:3770955-Amphidinium_carterae.1